MIVQQELIKKIKDFGLNSYEAKIWTALLSRGVSSAGELSEISNVPRSRTYDVLESLEKKGFIMMKLGKPIKYMAISPNEVIDRIKKKIQDDSSKQEKQIDELKGSAVLLELTQLHTTGIDTVDPSELAGVIKSRENLYNHMELMIKNAEKYVYIITSEKGFTRKLEQLKKVFKKANDNGVKIRMCAPYGKDVEKLMHEFKGIVDFKNISSINARFVIVDGKEMLFMVTDDADVHPSYDSGMWINSPFFTGAMKELFEMAWKKN